VDEKAAVEALKQIKEVFDEHGIEFWLNYGTLLGAIREKKFIGWDSDIDLAVWDVNSAVMKTCAKELSAKGFEIDLFSKVLSIKKENCPIPIGITFFRLNEDGTATADAAKIFDYPGRFLHYLILRGLCNVYSSSKKTVKEKSVKIIHCTLTKFPPKFKKALFRIAYLIFSKTRSFYFIRAIPSKYFTNLSTISFYGMKFKIPSRTNEYLTYIYGASWNTPIKNFPKKTKQSKLWQLRKGTYNKIRVKCPKCGQNYVIENPHKKDGRDLIKLNTIKCKKCKCEWIERVFILGTIPRTKQLMEHLGE